jgi:hypothetical protein
MYLLGAAIIRAKHTASQKGGGRTEERTACGAHGIPPFLFVNEITEMRASQRGPVSIEADHRGEDM